MWLGVGFALIAGALWGLVFLVPLLLPEYPAALLAMARYLAFGLLCLPLAWLDWGALRRLTRADWLAAAKLAAVGNLAYYTLLASSIQGTGGPLTTLIIGTLPVVIAIAANQRNAARDGLLPWRRLLLPLGIMLLGIALVNQAEMTRLLQQPDASLSAYTLGALLALGALACWTWYPLRNADWLRQHPERNPRVWATAQGLATLPMALVGFALVWGWMSLSGSTFPMPLGPDPLFFLWLMLALGLFASWCGILCWNQASKRLPTALAGQLIVFETVAALIYIFWWRGEWPQGLTVAGMVLLLLGVWLALRIRPVPAVRPAAV